MRNIFYLFLTLVAIVSVVVFVYLKYDEEIYTFLVADDSLVMYVESSPLSVTIADEPAEHRQGLSGVESLSEFEGKLFIFPKEDYYGMWMKDMLFPIDIIWIDNDLRIVHIEENVSPATFPDTFATPVPARFVLETNAFFAKSANVEVGDVVSLPARATPRDLLDALQ